MKFFYLLLTASLAMCATDDPYAAQLFQKHCASCHDSASGAAGRVPQVSVLKTMTPAAIQRTLESGVMKVQAAPLSGDEKLKLASLLGTAVTTERGRGEIANLCAAGAAYQGPVREAAAWASWGGGLANTRFQSAKDAGFQAEDLPRLKLKWAFAFPDTSTMRSQPAVSRGRVFIGGQDGGVYALDAATGCTYWSTAVQSQVALRDRRGRDRRQFRDILRRFRRLCVCTRWRHRKAVVEDARGHEHPASTVTATPVFYQGRVYVGSASREEALSVAAAYPCCTFRGSEMALDATTGKVLWKRYMIPDVAKEHAKSQHAAAVWGPSGVGVWTRAYSDPEHNTMYVTTGDNYCSDPATPMSDAVVRFTAVHRGDSLVQTVHG